MKWNKTSEILPNNKEINDNFLICFEDFSDGRRVYLQVRACQRDIDKKDFYWQYGNLRLSTYETWWTIPGDPVLEEYLEELATRRDALPA